MAPGLLVVSRNSPKDIKIRDLYIELDGNEIAALEYEKSYEGPLIPGEHTLTATNRLYHRSESFTSSEGERVAFEVANIASGCGGLMFIVVGMGPYKVKLKRV